MQRMPAIVARRSIFASGGSFALTLAAALLGIPACPAAAGDFQDPLFGDWGGIRSSLVEKGLRLDASYTGEQAANLSGGVSTESAYLDLSELKLTLNGEQMLDWRGFTAHLHALRTHGRNPSEFVGDAQGVSNIAAPKRTRILEAWVQQNFDGLSLLLGRYDLNTEFYYLQSAGLFLNSSFGIGPEFSGTGLGGPSLYPDTAVGGRVEARTTSSMVMRGAVLNGVPVSVPRADGSTGIRKSGDGLLLVGEAALLWPKVAVPDFGADGQPGNQRRRVGRAAVDIERDGKLAFGAWHYTGTFEHLSRVETSGAPAQENGSSGFYLVGEQVLRRDPQDPARRIRVFAQIGIGDDNVARFSRYFGGGITFAGLFPRRAGDEFGIAIAAARNGAPYIESERNQGRDADDIETTIEITYLAQLASWLTVQPSVQHVVNPGTDPSRRDATAALLRFEVTF